MSHDHEHLDEGTRAWHSRLHHTPHDGLSADTAQSAGMQRYEAISGKLTGSRKLWMGRTDVLPGKVSSDHHHGEAETGIYVVSGHPRFVFLGDDGDEKVVDTVPGDYIYVPPFVPHREENPSEEETAVVVIARSTQEGIVVNLPSLRVHVPELDALIAEIEAEGSA
jgi:uncharacterized RmlC-like cupin family protein